MTVVIFGFLKIDPRIAHNCSLQKVCDGRIKMMGGGYLSASRKFGAEPLRQLQLNGTTKVAPHLLAPNPTIQELRRLASALRAFAFECGSASDVDFDLFRLRFGLF